MESAITFALLVAQGIIMFSLGIGLEVKDFKRVIERPYVFFVAMLSQVVLLPLLAFGTAYLFDFPPVFAAGLMLLSFCPGGVTSNIISKLSKADVALSVSLTAVVSVLAFMTVPVLVAMSMKHFLGEESVTFSLFDLAFVTFLITTIPVLLGVLIRHFKENIANAIQGGLEKTAIVLWVIIVVLAIANSFDRLVDSFAVIGGGLLFLPFIMMVIGIIVSRLFALNKKESKTLGIETSIQNGPLAIAIAATINDADLAITELALPAAVYSITMYFVALPFIFIFRNWGEENNVTGASAVASK
ncbi:bile acid:sodium symporter family protein [Thalassotalea euphylliae]|uniref:Bile acid:sodium symporter family protein n=1 Tax=Thalassotalea euphylliae TaxID=1655234 RepID=A0A3E0TML7_9GAMM|nr:bile acid:sodium symporter family protein [Thalassotalea euphylliae]REL25510.1 bile acid:sodium symporter family protein [Thalassotalea euphylliae]